MGTFLEPLFKRLSLAVRRHVFPSLGITVMLTLGTLFLLLNPWFGSQWVKYKAITFMVGGADDVEYILKKAQGNRKLASSLTAGAARAGFFTSSDRNIVVRWSDQFFGQQRG